MTAVGRCGVVGRPDPGWPPSSPRPATRPTLRPAILWSHHPDVQDLLRPDARGPRVHPRGLARRGRGARRARRHASSTSARPPSGRGHVAGATHISKSYLEQQIEAAVPDRDTPVVLYCAGGVRSLFAAQTLPAMGYTRRRLHERRLPGLEVRGPRRGRSRSSCPRSRSSATAGTCSSRRSAPRARRSCWARKVLFIGAGGLGSPALLYLAAAGVGTIGIVDFDVVDLSNLQRQIVHTNDRVGRKKTESRRRRPSARSTPTSRSWPTRRCSTEDNVERIIAGYDVILDGTDTFETRYTLNDAAVRAGIPVVHASVFRFEGQLTVLQALRGPVLSLPVSHAAAAGAGARLLRGRRAGRRARHDGPAPGDGGHQGPAGHRRPAVRPAAHLRRPRRSFSELQLRRDPHCPACGDGVPGRVGRRGVFALPAGPVGQLTTREVTA